MAREVTPAGRLRRHLTAAGAIKVLDKPLTTDQVRALIGADTLDSVALHHLGRPLLVMFVDDRGHEKRLPVNAMATTLYHANCRPGTTHTIRGDVVIAPDADFGGSL